MTIQILDTDARVLDVPLRMPFEYGTVTLTECPLLFLEATVEIDGRTTAGITSETVAPRWFLKGTTYEESLDAMLDVITAARERALAVEGDTVFECWRRLSERQREWAESTDYPPLLWSFGVSLVERTLIDAWCRAEGTTFARAVRDGGFGVDLGAIHPELAGAEPADLLPDPRRSVAVRHTVGHTDPLTDAEIPADRRLDDGLPQSLADYIRTEGISHFKIKLAGDVAADVERVTAVADVVTERLSEYAFTVDANEGYDGVEAVRAFWERFAAERPEFSERVLAIEQPIPRAEAFSDATASALSDWDGPPVIIDESDGDLDSLPRALASGYAGTSHKNCKGVFKGVANACLIEHRNRREGDRYVVTAEDLMNLGPVALAQDLAVVATLGIDNVERNGHHYVRGLSFLPEEIAERVGEAHPDLYREHERGFRTLDVDGGAIDLESVVDAPFGVEPALDIARFEPLESLRPG